MADRQLADLVDHDGAVESGVRGDPEQRCRQRVGEHIDAHRLVTRDRVTKRLQRRPGLHQSTAATGDDAFLNRGLGCRHGVVDTKLALFECGLGGRTHLDDRDAAGQLGHPLLELFPIPLGVGGLDLALQLPDPVDDRVVAAATVDDHGVVLAHHDAAGGAEHLKSGLTQQQADVGVDHLTTGHDGQVLQERLAAVAEEGSLDRHGLEGLANRVDYQSRKRLTLNVFGHNQQRLTGLGHLFQDGQQVRQGADLVAVQEDIGVLEDGFLGVEVIDEVRRDEPLVEADPLADLQLRLHGGRLDDADDAVTADLGHRFADQFTDHLVA